MILPAPAFEWVCQAASTGISHGEPGLQSYLGFAPKSSTLQWALRKSLWLSQPQFTENGGDGGCGVKPQGSPSAHNGISSVWCLPSSQAPGWASSWGPLTTAPPAWYKVQGAPSGSLAPSVLIRDLSPNTWRPVGLWTPAGGEENISNLNEIWFSCLTKQ